MQTFYIDILCVCMCIISTINMKSISDREELQILVIHFMHHNRKSNSLT